MCELEGKVGGDLSNLTNQQLALEKDGGHFGRPSDILAEVGHLEEICDAGEESAVRPTARCQLARRLSTCKNLTKEPSSCLT